MNEGVIVGINNLSVKLQGVDVLKSISLSLNAGENLAITGLSGSGKTTLLKALHNEVFYNGTIEIAFVNDNFLKPFVNYIQQQHGFKTLANTNDFYYQQRFNSMDAGDAQTVTGELNIVIAKHKINIEKEKVEALLKALHLFPRKDAAVLQLSSGEHKRLQLAVAIITKANVLLMDNPFTGLDVNGKAFLNDILNEITASGVKLIMVTNDLNIPPCITKVLRLDRGLVEYFGDKENYQHTTSHQPKKENRQLPESIAAIEFEDVVKMVNVTVAYGEKVVLDKLNWQVRKGERWLLRGENGAGKSTLLSLITGDNPKAYSNEIYLFDKRRGSGESIWDIKKNTGYLSPEVHWYFDKNISVFNTIGSGFFDTIGLFKKLNEQQHETINQWLEYFELTAAKDKRLTTLSAGEQRIVLLIRALVKSPSLLILDEPCQGLDEEQSKQFIEIVDAMMQQQNSTLIYVTHNPEEVPGCVTKELVLKKIL